MGAMKARCLCLSQDKFSSSVLQTQRVRRRILNGIVQEPCHASDIRATDAGGQLRYLHMLNGLRRTWGKPSVPRPVQDCR